VRRTPSEQVELLRSWAQRLDQDGFAGIEDLGLHRSSNYTPIELAAELRRAATIIEFNDRFAHVTADFS
jgi:hypothetical protein